MKKNKKLKKKRSNKNFLIKVILFFIIIFSLILISLIFINFETISKIKNIFKNPEMYSLKDECVLLMNNIFHTINNEDDCKNFCRNHCSIENKKYNKVEFILNNNSCNSCYCYCK